MYRLASIILPLLCLMNFLFAANGKTSQPDTLKTYWLSEIIVTAPQTLPAPLPVHEIKATDIQKLTISDAQQALLFVPSLYSSTSAKNESTFRLRGIDQREISVFLDGIPISVPFDGIVDLSQFVGDNIAKIHVAQGVSPVLFGTNNIGGSVNIITQEPSVQKQVKLRLENNPLGAWFNSFSFGGTSGKLMYFTAFNYKQSANFVLPKNTPVMPNEDGGRRDHSSYTKMSGFVKLRYVLNEKHQIGLLFNRIDNKFDIPPNALSQRPRFWRFPLWRRSLFSLNTNHAFKGFLVRSVWYFDQYRNKLKSYDDASYSTQSKRYAFTSLYDDYSLGFNLYPEAHLFSFGKTAGLVSFKKNVHRQGPSDNQLAEYAIQTFNFGIEQNVHLGRNFSGQIAGDFNHLKPVKAQNDTLREALTLVNGQIALRYFLNKHWDFHIASAHKSRFPTLKELYSEYLGRSIPNPHLKPEYGLNNEFGLNFQKQNLKFTGTVFYNRLKNLIVPAIIATDQGKNLNQMQNIGKATFWGVEFLFQQKWQNLTWYAHYTFLQARNQSRNRTSPYLEYRPQHQFFLLTDYKLGSHWILETDWQGYFEQYYQNQDNLKWKKLNDYALLNLKAAFRWNPKFQFYVRVTNLFDRFYYSEWGVPMPGRQFILGIESHL